MMKFLQMLTILPILCTVPVGSRVHAEFVRTRASGIYQHDSRTVKVIVGSKTGGQGILVLLTPPIASSDFSLASLDRKDISQVFVRFDESAHVSRYSEVLVNGQGYPVKGNLTVKLGDRVDIGIDNTSGYVSVLVRGRNGLRDGDVLGFSGLNEVVRTRGEVSALLAANSLYAALPEPPPVYRVEGTRLGGMETANDSQIGSIIAPQHECLARDGVVLDSADVAEIEGAPSPETAMQLFGEIVGREGRSSVIRSSIVLHADPRSAVILDITTKKLLMVRSLIPSGLHQRVCVVAEVPSK
jgi:hypothetical protein